MNNNIEKIQDHDMKLSDLNERSDTLEESSRSFMANSTKVKKKIWWQNTKMKIFFGTLIVIAFIIVIAVIIEKKTK